MSKGGALRVTLGSVTLSLPVTEGLSPETGNLHHGQGSPPVAVTPPLTGPFPSDEGLYLVDI